MRIGIDCRTILNPRLGERAGVGHYTLNLVKRIISVDTQNEYVLYFDYRMRDVQDFKKKNVTVKFFPFSQYGKFLSFGYSHMLISAYLLKEGLDLYHVPAGSVPLTYRKKVIYTVHDLAIYKNPDWFPSQILSRHLLTPQSLKAANHIIAVSKSTKKDLKDLFNIQGKKVDVVYEGADVTKVPLKRKKGERIEKSHLPKQYILFIGTLEPRKNLSVLLRAYKKMIQSSPTLSKVPVVIAGHKGHKHEMVFNEVTDLGLSKQQFRYLGYVTHNEKIELYQHATTFVFPSLYEGFGIPVLEAMSLGVPVICSNVSSLPEITGKDGALLVDPENEQGFADAMRDIITNNALREKVAANGKKRAEQFSWERAAQETVAVYKKAMRK